MVLPMPAAEIAPRPAPPAAWIFLSAGLITAPVFTLTPVLGAGAWVLVSAIHEMGHTTFAWCSGSPAVPVLDIFSGSGGHAATFRYEPIAALQWAAWALIIALAVRTWTQQSPLRWCAALSVVIYPVMTWEPHARELGQVLAGHIAELVFASICLWRARTGRSTAGFAERATYGCVGWYFLFNAAWLQLGLTFVPSVRTWYEGARSYGIANDYLRAADALHAPLGAVALLMFVLTLAAGTMPLLWRSSQR